MSKTLTLWNEEEVQRRPRETWLTPFWDIWKEKFGIDPTPGTMVRSLRKCADEPDAPAAFKNYLDATRPQFINLWKFSDTWTAWKSCNDPYSLVIRPGESLDQYQTRLAAL